MLESVRYLQSVGDHSVEQLWNVVMFDDKRRAKPLRIILGVSANPFTRPLSERPNEGKRSLWQNPDVGFTGGTVHCLASAFAFIILLRKSESKVPEDIPKEGQGLLSAARCHSAV